ncbi:MAG: cupin domain-containing protein [Granulosicoccus sp.]|nr:cupin domain-containing protein [Granulosicoccus sp.]
MDVNGDFNQRVLLHTDEIDWEDSPMVGVTRRRLDRVNRAEDRVTTIVRYAPGSHFSSHIHTGGEELLILDGVFEDDYGHWPAGSYIRNPPTSSHTPGSEPGCTLFVKLCQFDPDDRTFVHADINKLGATPDRNRPGVSISPLYKDSREEVRVEQWDSGATIELDARGGAEVFILEGECSESGDQLRQHSWLRVPTGTTLSLSTGDQGARAWIKTGHLSGLAI